MKAEKLLIIKLPVKCRTDVHLHVALDTNGRLSQEADGHLSPPQIAVGHLDLGSNVQSSTSWSSNLIIGHLSRAEMAVGHLRQAAIWHFYNVPLQERERGHLSYAKRKMY